MALEVYFSNWVLSVLVEVRLSRILKLYATGDTRSCVVLERNIVLGIQH